MIHIFQLWTQLSHRTSGEDLLKLNLTCFHCFPFTGMTEANLYLTAEFSSDAECDPRNPFNMSIMTVLIKEGYESYDFLPPVDDSAWGDKMLKVLTGPMVEYVKNRLRLRSRRLAGEFYNQLLIFPRVFRCSFVCFCVITRLRATHIDRLIFVRQSII